MSNEPLLALDITENMMYSHNSSLEGGGGIEQKQLGLLAGLTQSDEPMERKESVDRLSVASIYSASHVHPQNSPYLTTFLLINTMIGSGILNQPYVFSQAGILGGIIGFIIASTSTWLGLVLMTAAGVHANVLEYGGLAKFAFGKFGENLIDYCIVINAFGSQLGYILIVGDTLSELLRSWGCSTEGCGYISTTIWAVGIFVTPICLFRHFGHLAYLSIFSILTIVLVLCLVIIGGPLEYEPGSGVVKILDIGGAIRSTGSIVFAVTCASANFQGYITTDEKYRNFNSWSKITGAAVGIGSSMCMFMGIAGYLSFRDNTDGEILNNFNGHGFDFFKVMVVCHLILYIPVNFVIMRYSVVKLSTNTRSELLPIGKHTVLSVVLLFFTVGTELLLRACGFASGTAFTLILNITGGVGGSLSAIILPAAMYVKIMPKDAAYRNVAIGLVIFGIVVMIAVLVEVIINLNNN
jgi:sodium-coupled neutral amino acid transporter 11